MESKRKKGFGVRENQAFEQTLDYVQTGREAAGSSRWRQAGPASAMMEPACSYLRGGFF